MPERLPRDLCTDASCVASVALYSKGPAMAVLQAGAVVLTDVAIGNFSAGREEWHLPTRLRLLSQHVAEEDLLCRPKISGLTGQPEGWTSPAGRGDPGSTGASAIWRKIANAFC